MRSNNDKLSPFIATSAVLHVTLVGVVLFVPSLFPPSSGETWGTSMDKGVKAGLTQGLPGIPLPSPPVVNEAAKPNDSKTLNPVEPAPKAPEKVPEKAADVKIPSGVVKPEKKKDPEPPRMARGATAPPDLSSTPSNAIPGGGGQLALPYGSVATGSGPATFGDGSFGTRFPLYVNSMIRAIETSWQDSAAGVPRGTAPRVYVKFTIAKGGRVSGVELDQSSGSSQLDSSARRAVLTAKLPPLPPEYRGSSVEVRFYFEYAR